MLITMRLPRAAAEKMGIEVGAGTEEVEVSLPAVELAGRMTMATGRAISLGAVEKYCATLQTDHQQVGAMAQPAREERRGRAGPLDGQRRLSRPFGEEGALDWLSTVLTECYL